MAPAIIFIVLAAILVLFVISYIMFGLNAFKLKLNVREKILKVYGIIGKGLLILILSMFFIIPLWILLAASFTDSVTFMKNGYSMIIGKFSFDAYEYVFKNPDILKGLLNSVFVSVVVTILSVVVNTLAAYVLSEKKMPGHKILNGIFVFTMLFSSGMVPIVLVIRQLGLYNSYWALIIPPVINVYNILLIRNYLYTIPESLKEAAKVDGANSIQIFFEVILPVSLPIIVTTGLMAFVLKWNAYMDILYYIKPGSAGSQFWTIQYVIKEMLSDFESKTDYGILSKYVVQSATIIVSIVPLLIIFPFLQKYFTQGVTNGAVKG